MKYIRQFYIFVIQDCFWFTFSSYFQLQAIICIIHAKFFIFQTKILLNFIYNIYYFKLFNN